MRGKIKVNDKGKIIKMVKNLVDVVWLYDIMGIEWGVFLLLIMV